MRSNVSLAELDLPTLDEVRQERARRSLGAFATRVLGLVPARHHAFVNGKLEAIERDEIRRLMLFEPPGHAKSTYAIHVLGGASAHVGTEAAAIPGLFAAMFTARQGFIFGLIYGGAVCRKAGLPMEAFAAQVPVTLSMAGNYADLFMRTVPTRTYDDPGATVAV